LKPVSKCASTAILSFHYFPCQGFLSLRNLNFPSDLVELFTPLSYFFSNVGCYTLSVLTWHFGFTLHWRSCFPLFFVLALSAPPGFRYLNVRLTVGLTFLRPRSVSIACLPHFDPVPVFPGPTLPLVRARLFPLSSPWRIFCPFLGRFAWVLLPVPTSRRLAVTFSHFFCLFRFFFFLKFWQGRPPGLLLVVLPAFPSVLVPAAFSPAFPRSRFLS